MPRCEIAGQCSGTVDVEVDDGEVFGAQVEEGMPNGCACSPAPSSTTLRVAAPGSPSANPVRKPGASVL